MINEDRPTTTLVNEDKIGSFSGSATLVAGTKTIATSDILATDNIVVGRTTVGGVIGNLSTSTVVAGVSFNINSTSATDTSVVSWQFAH